MEILSPSAEHDIASRIFARLVELLAEEADVDVENAGSTTFRREDLARGFEPDECFYFSEDAKRIREIVRGKGNIELDAGDPPPDMVWEVNITNPSLDKLPIYARLGVTEVWRHNGERSTIFGMAEGGEGYAEAPESGFLHGVTGEALTRLVGDGLTLDRRTWRRGVRGWARGHTAGPETR